MKIAKQIKTFRDQYPLIGPIMWILSVQYFIVQFIVAKDWSTNFSISKNTISDLGNTHCGIYSGRYICSPLHGLMNFSLIILGVFMVFGSILIYQEFKRTIGSFIGFECLFLAGIGTLLVGLFPENTISGLHTLGAFLPFFVGNIGLVILSLSLNVPKLVRIYTFISGFIALVGLVLFYTNNYLDLGIGGMERVTAYPQTLWLIVFGIYISRNHFMKVHSKQ